MKLEPWTCCVPGFLASASDMSGRRALRQLVPSGMRGGRSTSGKLLAAMLGAVAQLPSGCAPWLHYVGEDAHVCDHVDSPAGGDPDYGVCAWGQCCVHTRGCLPGVLDRCVDGQGTCYQRLANQSDIGQPATDSRDALDDKRYLNSPELTMIVRYCKCEPGFVGPVCETKMNPLVPLLYVVVGYGVSTWLLFFLLESKTLLHPPRLTNRQIKGGINSVKASQLTMKCLSFIVESFMMASGVFSYSVQWSEDFLVITVLRLVGHSLMEAFTVFAHLFLPETWSSRDTFSIQVMFSTALPLLLLAQAWGTRIPNQATGEMELTANGNFIIYTVLPLFTIPVVGVLFKPIVSCHLQAGLLQSAQPAAEDQYFTPRSAPPEELFLPPSERTDCSFGTATTNYFWMGFCLLVPFWFVGLYFGTCSVRGEHQRFPVLKGYQAWHTQLLVGCALAYRAFKRHHPRLLCVSLLALNVLELGLLWRWRPCDIHLLNAVRLTAHSLAVIWCILGVLAASISDSSDDTSGMLLMSSMVVWIVVILHVWRRRRFVVGIAGGAPQIANDAEVGSAVPGLQRRTLQPTFEMEESAQANGAGGSGSGDEHAGDGHVLVGSVVNTSNGSAAVQGEICATTSTMGTPDQQHINPQHQQMAETRSIETTTNPVSVSSRDSTSTAAGSHQDVASASTGSSTEFQNRTSTQRHQLSAAELQARKERSDRARATMRKNRGGSRPNGSSFAAQLDIEALMERQKYLQRPEVDRFLSSLGQVYADYWPKLQENGWGGVEEMDLCSEVDLQAIGIKPGHAKLIVVRWKRHREGEASSFTHKFRGVPR